MNDYRITVRLNADLRRRLKEATHRNGTRESDIVRDAVEHQFAAEDNELTAYDYAERAGLIGAIRGASRDLSTNLLRAYPQALARMLSSFNAHFSN